MNGRSPGGSATARRAAAWPTNTAAWLRTRRGAIEVGSAQYTPPRENEIVVRNRAVAVNPRDWRIQLGGHLLYRWLRYPAVIGTDAAREVVEVGPGVTRFKPGNRVLGHAVGVERDHNRLGASQAFDYRSKTVTGDVIRWLRGTELAGAFAIAAGSAGPSAEIISVSEGAKILVLASAPGRPSTTYSASMPRRFGFCGRSPGPGWRPRS